MNYTYLNASCKNVSFNCMNLIQNNSHRHKKVPKFCSLSNLSFNKKNVNYVSPSNNAKLFNNIDRIKPKKTIKINYCSNDKSNFNASVEENNITIPSIINTHQSNKKIFKRNFNNLLNKYSRKNPNTFNYFKISKTTDEDISINESKTVTNEKNFEKLEQEFEIRNLKQKLHKLNKNNISLKEKISKLKNINNSIENNINFQHNKNKMIICELINIYYQGELDKKNRNEKLKYKDLLFSLMDLKIDYENKKLIEEFFNGITQIVTFSKISNNSKNINYIKNSDIYVNYFEQLLQIINENKDKNNNNPNNCDAELIEKIKQCNDTVNYCNYYKKILKTTLNNGNNDITNKSININENDNKQINKFYHKVTCITDSKNAYNRYKEIRNYSNKNNTKENKKLFFKKYFHIVKNPINDIFSLKINANSLSTEKNNILNNNTLNSRIKDKKILWNLKMKKNKKLSDNNNATQILNFSSAKLLPLLFKGNNKKLKYYCLNGNNNLSYNQKAEGIINKNNFSQRSNGKKTNNYLRINAKKTENNINDNSKQDLNIKIETQNLSKKNQSYINLKI